MAGGDQVEGLPEVGQGQPVGDDGQEVEALLEQGNYPAIATHDESLISDVVEWTRGNAVGPSRFEFQMLYGLRPGRWDELVRDGFNVRIYVPYGTHWFPYFYRRLRERKENVFFVLRSLFGR